MEIPSQYLNGPMACACGQTHRVPIRKVVIGQAIDEELCAFVKGLPASTVLVVSDENTFAACGGTVVDALRRAGIETTSFVLRREGHDLHPDERSVSLTSDAIQRVRPDLVIGTGSGVINDTVRFTTFQAGIPYVIVGTAPSMDGYASSIAAMQFAGVKTTLPAHSPIAIFADVDVLANAPWPLIQAGFGDLLGKLTSLLDWKLAHVLYGEDFCETSYRLVLEPLQYTILHVDALVERNREAVLQLFNGLVSAGISMAMVGNSRPCSGCEHHCSHYWDLLAYQGKRPETAHGLQVGYATHWTIRFYQYASALTHLNPPVHLALNPEWESYARQFYGEGADEVVRAQQEKFAWLEARAAYFGDKAIDTVRSALEPEISMISRGAEALHKMGIPDEVGFLDVDASMLRQTFLHARELRARYTVFDLLVGQNQLNQAVDSILKPKAGR